MSGIDETIVIGDANVNINRSILDSMSDWVRVLDNDGKIVYANRSMIRNSKENPIGVNCCKGVGYESKGIPKGLTCKYFRVKGVVKEERKIEDRHFSIKSSPIYDSSDTVIGTVEVFRDITRETQAKIGLIDVNKKLYHDISFARKIQRQILPKAGEYNGLRIDYKYISSEQLSGDMFDVIEIDNDRVGVYISDIVGHGVAASILTMFVRQTMRYLVSIPQDPTPSAVLKNLIKRFGELNLDDDKYFTIFYGVFNRKTKEFTYANAGHNATPIKYNNKGYEVVESRGFPISFIFAEGDYVENSVQLEKHDKVLFYTDGITETKDFRGEEFGQEKLITIVKKNKNKVLDDVVTAVNGYRWGEQEDDIALLLMEVI